MDYQLIPSTLVILISFLTFLFLVTKILTTKHTPSPLTLIPGPKKLPLIGNLHNIISFKDVPIHNAFKHLSTKHGALMHIQLGQVPYVVVSSVEAAKQVLRTHDVIFANRPPVLAALIMTYNYTDVAFAPYGPHWRHLRKICTLELLSVRRVQSFRPVREEEINVNLARWIAGEAGSPCDLSERLYLTSFGIATRASIGKRTEDEERVTSAIKRSVEMSSGFSIVDLYPSIKMLPIITGIKFKVERCFRETDRVIESVIRQHRVAKEKKGVEKSEDDDIVDVLLRCQRDGSELPLTDDHVKGVLLNMFIAGGETSANVVEWGMSEMMKNPTTLEKAQKEVREVFDHAKGYVDEAEFGKLLYLKLVIKETLRLHPPAPFLIPRQNSEACEINGYEIPAKTRVIVNAWALARDPMYWKDEAEKFKPERFMNSSVDFKGNDFEYMPFGAGRRICPGISFGMANVEFMFAMLLYHFDWEMPNGMKGEELDMREAVGATVKRKHHLVLVPTVVRPLQQ